MMEMGRERQRMVGVYGQKLRGNDREAEGSMGRQGEGMDLPRLAFASGYGPGKTYIVTWNIGGLDIA